MPSLVIFLVPGQRFIACLHDANATTVAAAVIGIYVHKAMLRRKIANEAKSAL